MKVPHMGWNSVRILIKNTLFLIKYKQDEDFYFVHSYKFNVKNNKFVLAKTYYGGDITAVVLKDNIIGTQFHPEKSQACRHTIYKKFFRVGAMIDNNKKLSVNLIKTFSAGELQELCKATEDAITAGIGFSWIKPPPRQNLENYWKGVLAMPQRNLFIGSFEGAVAASLQLVFPE